MTLKELLTEMFARNASDLHINVGIPPTIRIDGKLTPLGAQPLTAEETKRLCEEVLSNEQLETFARERSVDLAFAVAGIARFRANIFWSCDAVAGAFRTIPFSIPKPIDINLPRVVVEMTRHPRGLVLVTGPTGSGKSTTLASLIDHINESRADHIITIEDPIEYEHHQKRSVINQREIGRDAVDFQSALKYILRQDPDVVLIGEMRDLETIQSAITVAETGHLVFATLHTNAADQTIDRIVDVFPSHQQPQIRTQLSLILQGIVCQQLLPKKTGGRTLALEILIPTSGIRNLIREGKVHQISSTMQMGQQETQMCTLDQSLAKLVREGLVEHDEAFQRAVNRDEFLRYLKD